MLDEASDSAILTPDQGEALQRFMCHLSDIGYHFVTPTPATHSRVLARAPGRLGTKPQEILGWSLPFDPGAVDPVIPSLLSAAGLLRHEATGLARSDIRVSKVRGRLFAHSAYPTVANDAVFLGPDTYRFADLIAHELQARPATPGLVVVDMGTGSGAGAVVAADLLPGAHVIVTDINPRALALARVNSRHAGCAVEAREGRNLAGCPGPLDVILANPPYIMDPAGRAYRDGGAMHGAAIAIEMTDAALPMLGRGGSFILYTGSAIVGGGDPLRARLAQRAKSAGTDFSYRELDPDVFGEELEGPAYEDVDRIAAVAAVFHRR